ncbi:GerMN domain-containing protein [Paenibacillus sp. N3/727]|uniref:GerMN domain-containing protein n=1 Tax=Paenibacillus sp. N3/727 TaxID=2925845 RepID=UPI001F53E2C8|nr:GerMN domain-containing protein [Paenibacillus sp. N3/727]UNK20596.1 GerMN domain-containing protein [Paenibacillus sp. N3/727]
MNKKIWSVGLLAAVMVLGAGCGQKPGAAPGNTSEQTGSTNGAGGSSQTPEETTETITVYYTDPELLELQKGSSKIMLKKSSEKYEATFEALKKSDSAEMVSLWEKAELNSSTFEDGKLTLDLHIPDEARLGSGGELFAVDALKKTFFQFEEVKSLQLLVDGKQVESLMGHVELENPETR